MTREWISWTYARALEEQPNRSLPTVCRLAVSIVLTERSLPVYVLYPYYTVLYCNWRNVGS